MMFILITIIYHLLYYICTYTNIKLNLINKVLKFNYRYLYYVCFFLILTINAYVGICIQTLFRLNTFFQKYLESRYF